MINYHLLPQFRPARLQDLVLWYEPWSFRGRTWSNLAPCYSGCNDGTAHGVGLSTWHPQFPPALEFYGSSEYVRVSHDPCFDFGYDPFSIEMIIKAKDKSDYRALVFHYYGKGYSLLTNKDVGTLRVWVGTEATVSNTDVCDDELHHIVVTRGSAPDYLLKFYIDKELDITPVTRSGLATPNSVIDIGIGMYIEPHFGKNPFKGTILSLRMYKAELSQAEVTHNWTHHPLYLLKRGIDPYMFVKKGGIYYVM